MKDAKVSAIFVRAFGLMVWLVWSVEAAPMGTVFTYQGRLIDVNGPADGQYDFEFKLYPDPNSGGFQIFSTAVVDDHDVIDGYFTVELDFGQYAFNGDARWLEIAVRPGDSNDSHTILSPRQQVTPTPYAIRAHIADSSADGVIGSGTTNRLAKFTATKVVSDSAIYESGGNVGIGTNSPESRLQVEQSAGAWDEGIRLSYGDHVWDIVTDYGGERLTIAPDQNSTRGLVMRNGKAGFGTSSPEAKLQVNQNVGAWGEGIRLSYGDHEWDFVTDSGGERLFIAPDQTSEKGLTIIDGRVGIGTASPQADVEVRHTPGLHRVIKATASDGSDLFYVAEHTALGNGFLGIMDGAGTSKVFITANGNSYFNGGNVSVGNTYPQARLDVDGDLKVSGAYKGDIGPNNGAPFPRPAYDSGWVAISTGGSGITLTHNIGGNVDNYVVDLQTSGGDIGIHNFKRGSDTDGDDKFGVYYKHLTTSSIVVYRFRDDQWSYQARVRIWVYN